MKKLIVVLFLGLSLLPLHVFSQSNVIDEVVWVVGDDPILKSEIEEQILWMQYNRMPTDGDSYCVIAEQIALQKLFLHQAKIDSIIPSEGTVATQVEQRLSNIIVEAGSKEILEERYGKSYAQIKEQLHDQIRDQMTVQQMQQKIIGDQKVSPSEVRKYFSTLPSENIPSVPEKVEVQIITLEPKATAKEVASIKAKLQGFKDRVESGNADFAMLARLYSDDTESAKDGGELGFLSRSQLVPEFAEAAFSLQDNQKISRIVETDFGFHIIQLIEKRGDKVNCRHILLRPYISLSEKNAAFVKLDSLGQAIREGKISFEQAAGKFSQDKNTYSNGGLMINNADGTSRFDINQLQQMYPGVARAIGGLNVGEVSKPFTMQNSVGREVCVVVKLKYRLAAHTANPNDDYQELKAALIQQRNADALQNWILKKQKETYISLDERFRNCDFKYPNWIKK